MTNSGCYNLRLQRVCFFFLTKTQKQIKIKTNNKSIEQLCFIVVAAAVSEKNIILCFLLLLPRAAESSRGQRFF